MCGSGVTEPKGRLNPSLPRFWLPRVLQDSYTFDPIPERFCLCFRMGAVDLLVNSFVLFVKKRQTRVPRCLHLAAQTPRFHYWVPFVCCLEREGLGRIEGGEGLLRVWWLFSNLQTGGCRCTCTKHRGLLCVCVWVTHFAACLWGSSDFLEFLFFFFFLHIPLFSLSLSLSLLLSFLLTPASHEQRLHCEFPWHHVHARPHFQILWKYYKRASAQAFRSPCPRACSCRIP